MKTTFEFAHEGTRTGIVLQVDGIAGPRMARAVGELAFHLAGEQADPPVCLPGWWAVVFGWAAVSFGLPTVQRVVDRAETHVAVQVARGSLVVDFPDWPLVRFGPSGAWHDLRGEAALRHGPSDSELSRYAAGAGLLDELATPSALRRMFDLGVIEWRRDAAGRLALHGAGSH